MSATDMPSNQGAPVTLCCADAERGTAEMGDLGFKRPSFTGRQIHIPVVHMERLNLIRLSETM